MSCSQYSTEYWEGKTLALVDRASGWQVSILLGATLYIPAGELVNRLVY